VIKIEENQAKNSFLKLKKQNKDNAVNLSYSQSNKITQTTQIFSQRINPH
jgi:hypothetical protein